MKFDHKNLEEKINPYESPRILDEPIIEKRLDFFMYVCLSPHIFPTLARKYKFPSFPKEEIERNTKLGMFLGAGLYVGTTGFFMSMYDPIKTPYAFLPVIIPLTTNLLSGAYELYRSKNKK